MREIKFRAWDTEKKEWVESFAGFDFVEPDSQSEAFWLSAPESIKLMQYTGLKDKNDKEIYEGDIIKHLKYNQGIYQVVYTPENTGYDLILVDGQSGMHLSIGCEPNIEIIGNIYENPDKAR